jgi:hypothetical protein
MRGAIRPVVHDMKEELARERRVISKPTASSSAGSSCCWDPKLSEAKSQSV